VKVLIAGETWVTSTSVTKGYDTFTTGGYGEGYSYLQKALTERGVDVEVMKSHEVSTDFPWSADGLSAYDAIVISDIGSRTFTLTKEVTRFSQRTPDRLELLRDWVEAGGALVMVGGYLTFQGIEAKGQWSGTAVEDVLPVAISRWDDRVERPAGAVATVVEPAHPVLEGVDGEWPHLLGWNRLEAKPGANVVVEIAGDPLLVLGEFGLGRSAVFASDISPHWAPQEFCSWPGYTAIWANIIDWVTST
jgi:uncharacterized membrane protein